MAGGIRHGMTVRRLVTRQVRRRMTAADIGSEGGRTLCRGWISLVAKLSRLALELGLGKLATPNAGKWTLADISGTG